MRAHCGERSIAAGTSFEENFSCQPEPTAGLGEAHDPVQHSDRYLHEAYQNCKLPTHEPVQEPGLHDPYQQ
eukprot:2266160-Prorocentrum_lima.AAC.1